MVKQFFSAHRRPFLYGGVLALVILLDQLTKALTVAFLELSESFPLWKGVLHFTYVQNRGMAFGMLADKRYVFMIFSTLGILAVLAYLFWFGRRSLNLSQGLSLAMIAGGGIGNMIDRIALGYVVDFIDFTLIDFAVFNVADSFVCVGAGLLFIALLMELKNEAKSREKR